MVYCQQKKLSIGSRYYIDSGQTETTKMITLQNTPYEAMYKYDGVPDNRLQVIYNKIKEKFQKQILKQQWKI